MGFLWGDEYSITTSAHSQAFFDDEASASPWSLIPLTAMVNDVKVIDVFRREIMVGLGARIERAYNIASTPSQFGQGLLNHTHLTDAIGAVETKAYLEGLHSEPVSVEYHHLSPLNLGHAGHQYLADSQGYDQPTNISTVQSDLKGFPVYLEHMGLRLNVPVGSILKSIYELPEWELAPSQRYVPWLNPNGLTPSWSYTNTETSLITLHFAWLGDTPVPGSPTAVDWAANGVPAQANPPDILNIPAINRTGFSFEAAFGNTDAEQEDFIRRYTIEVTLDSLGLFQARDYFQTKYLTGLSGTPVVHYFSLFNGTGAIPSIEIAAKPSSGEPTFFPLIFLRKDFVTLADPANAADLIYKQNANICRQIGFDYQSFATSVLEDADEESLSQLFLMFGIPINTLSPIGMRYVYEFFYWLNLNNTTQASQSYYTQGFWTSSTLEPKKLITFTDAGAVIRLEYIGSASRLKSGNFRPIPLAKIGECDQSLVTHTQLYTRRRRDQYGSDNFEWITEKLSRDIPVWVFRKQISATRYREVLVADPVMSYRLSDSNGGNTVYGAITDYKDLLIPLNHELALEYFDMAERTELYARSLHIQANAYQIDKLSWYETQAFGTFMIAASMIITVVSLGTATGAVQGIYASVLATVGSTAAAVIITALITIGIQVGLSKLFELVVREIGSEYGSFSALILAVVATFQATQGSPSAGNWAMAANGFVEASEAQLAEDVIKFDQDLARLADLYEDFLDTRKEFDDEMSMTENLMRAVGLASTNNPYESAEQYYARTASGALGPELSVNSAGLYFSSALKLPEFFGDN